MLASVLRLEALLKCDLCGNLLRLTRTLNECGHRFCGACIYDRLGKERQCPRCHIPAIVKNLRRDPMHDTMIACVKKLKQCMMETDLASLSVPPFDSANVDNNNESQSQQYASSSAVLPSLGTGRTEPENDTNTLPLSFAQPLPSSYDSDATTQSSQRLLTMSEDAHQTTDNNRRLVPPSTDDLLLAMEDEEVIEDELSDSDMPTTTAAATSITPVATRIQNNNTTDTNLSPAVPKQLDHIYASSDDLLAAMESEEIMMDDEDDDDDFASARPSLPNKSSHEQHIPPTSHRRRLSNNTNADEREPTTKHQKTEPTPNRSQFAIPHPPSTLNGDNHQSLRWRCTTCLYGGNEADDLVCGICRNEPADDVAMVSATAMVSEMTPATVPPTLDLSMPSRFVVPSTLTTEILQQQQKAGDGLNQDATMRMMVTALTAEDDVKLDISMTMAIDTCLKMEIYSDTRDVGNVTHLITSVNEQGLCTRTIKYLLCIMTGKWIVDTSWLIDSVQAGYWLPEEKYQVIGDKTLGVTHGPERGRLQRQQQRQDVDDDDAIRFFGNDDVRFFFYGDFPDNNTKLKLLQLVRQGGGKVLSRRPPLDQLQQDSLVVIVSSLDETLLSRKKAHAWLEKCAHVKDSQWLLDSIARSKWVLE